MTTAAQYGYATPAGTDYIKDGDNAITTNANVSAGLFDRAFTELPLRPALEGGQDFLGAGMTGIYPVPYTSTNYLNQPVPAGLPGDLLRLTAKNPNGLIHSALFVAATGGGVFYNSTSSGGVWQGWVRLDRPKGDPLEPNARRAMLVDAARRRRGGTLGTAGLGAVAFRFDHGLGNFRDKVLPLLQKHGIPFSLALNPANLAHAENGAATWADVQGWCLANGGEAVNHSRTHSGDAETEGEIRAEVVTGLDDLQAALPKLAVEGWAPPGLSAGQWGGYGTAGTLEAHYGTYAGRLILAHHAFVEGYIPHLHRDLDGGNDVGLGHWTADAQTVAATQGVIDGAVSTGGGTRIMVHPSLLDTTGYITTADLDAILGHAAAKRDAGLLELLTPSGLCLADARHDSRHNLLANGDFRDGLTGWTGTGWTTGSGRSGAYAETSGTDPLTQTVTLNRKDAYAGSARQLAYMVQAPTGATVRTAVAHAGGTATRDHTIPASATAWVEVRQPATIPTDQGTAAMTATIGRVSGGTVRIRHARLEAI